MNAETTVGQIARRVAKRVLAATSGRSEYYVARSMYEPYETFDLTPFATMNRRGFVDYVRWSTAELLKRELVERGIGGAVAEVGVGEGDFAWLLNRYFSDRKLYLFDTFSGFDSRDQDADVHAGLPSQPYPDPVASATQVRDLMPNPQLVDLRVGWFPESAAGLEGETFAFVHVDVGLHHPTLAALQWFFPRLAAHGYLLVADYGTSHTPGVRQAVREFASTAGAAYVVLPDRSGTAVFTKMS